MFGKQKNWFGSSYSKPKNVHSLENLRYLHHVLMKNAVVTDSNRSLLVETLRAISEILIWGDQNDSSVFDFFLEKNMLVYFLKILRQKTSRYICVQLLQTLNILFENIRNETSLYYLLSNNHVNSIIVHKFDFSDEEVLAYYISFLKTLSLKLNSHTIHFFYNEHTNDFALYTEAIKFFNHSESMVRIAVRTLTLNVYKVDDEAMQTYIRNKTAVPYFSNLVWFIGNHVLNLDNCVRNDVDHQSKDRLSTLVAEHLDHLHYVNDILSLGIVRLNDVLTDHLLNRLFIPLYVDSLTRNNGVGSLDSKQQDNHTHISSVVSLFLLSQVFLILKHEPIVSTLADIIFNGNEDTVAQQPTDISGIECEILNGKLRAFVAPEISLEQSMEKVRESAGTPIQSRRRPNYRDVDSPTEKIEYSIPEPMGSSSHSDSKDTDEKSDTTDSNQPVSLVVNNCTDEEKSLAAVTSKTEMTLANRPYLASIFTALKCADSDYSALFSLCLLYAIGSNQGIKRSLLESVCLTNQSENKQYYNMMLIEKLITVMSQACQYSNTKIRPVTLEMSTLLLEQLVCSDVHCYLQDMHLACIEGAKEESNLMLRNFYKGDELFLDMFEDEYQSMKSRPLNVEYLMMDSSLLLPPTATPMTGIDFIKRLPSGELERSRRAIRVFFLLRNHSLKLRKLQETQLPLTKKQELILIGDKLDLNNSDLIACSVLPKDKGQRQRRFLVMDSYQVILVEPDVKRLGWGVVKFVGPLQDVEVQGDKDDSRSLHVTIHKRLISSHAKPFPLLAARFIFDDHIRCMAAKQRLLKGRQKVRQMKMERLALLLEIPPPASPVGGSFSAAFSSRPGMAVPAGASRKLDPFATSTAMSDGKEMISTGSHHNVTSVHRKTPPVAMTGAPAHVKSTKAKVNSSPEVEEAQDAMSPSAYTTTSFVEDNHVETSRKLHIHQNTDITPPSLTPAQAPPLSLITDAAVESQSGSPRILPPASTARVRSLSHPGGEMHSDSSPIPLGKSPPGIHLNLTSAEVVPGEDQALGSATASLSRLTQMAQDLTTPDEAHFIEMTTLSTETVPIALQEEYEEDPFESTGSGSMDVDTEHLESEHLGTQVPNKNSDNNDQKDDFESAEQEQTNIGSNNKPIELEDNNEDIEGTDLPPSSQQDQESIDQQQLHVSLHKEQQSGQQPDSTTECAAGLREEAYI